MLFASIRNHNRTILDQCGIGALQLRALAVVRDRPDVGVSELAKTLMIRQPSASKVVDELVSRGMLSRRAHPTDGRAIVLRLRKAGTQTLAAAPGPHWGLLPDALGRMEPSRLHRLDEALSGLLDELELKSDEASLEPLTDA
ncbi:MAG TPA: MarR family transcriptional regulator [Xanthomonadaceae bacterium]